MSIFNFFKKKKTVDFHTPKLCLTEIPVAITKQIDNINWSTFETAYGNAEKTTPFYLKNLFCKDMEIAMDATHQLWCSLCHQHAFISSASLPSYDILKIGLLELDDLLKVELLDIFQGFAYCSSPTFSNALREPWELQLREKLANDKQLFEDFTKHKDEVIVCFAERIIDALTNEN
ncbi:hypothetical protein [Pedobacter frigiditerrae]|uniref:hypothetical protein n=1 Tax=Pedobacter frigiditerrae TaxID=2530452 RepID=UPI0029309A0D|nr:hypothetical protein [Pedobacter frigiditerrae]